MLSTRLSSRSRLPVRYMVLIVLPPLLAVLGLLARSSPPAAVAATAAAAQDSSAVDGPRPALEILEDSDELELSSSGGSLRWKRRRVLVCNRPGRDSEEIRDHSLMESFGWKPRDARVTRVSHSGRRRNWTLDDYRVFPHLSDGGFISDSKLHSLPLDALAAGDTLTLESTELLEPFLGFPLIRLGDAFFPPRRRVLEVRVPRDLAPRWALFNGAPEPARSEDGSMTRLTWEMGPHSPLTLDGWSPASVDLVPTVSLGVARMGWGPSGSWEEVAASYSRELVQRVALPAEDATLPRMPEARRAELAEQLRRVQGEVRYVGIALGPGGLIPHAPPEVDRRRFGDCKDMALLLRTELRAAGIEAALALVNTLPPAPERVDPLPTLRAFNHAVVYVAADSGGFWLDPTDRFGTPESPRTDIQGSPALILSGPDAGYRRIPRTHADWNRLGSYLTLRPVENGPWTLEARLTVTGSPAVDLKHFLSQTRPVAAGDRVTMAPQLLPTPVSAADADSFDVVAVEPNALELRGRPTCRLRNREFSGRTVMALPWKAAPGPLLELPRLPRDLPLEFERSRTYSDTLRIADGLDYFALPDTATWSAEGPDMAAQGEVRAEGRDVIVTRTVSLNAGWRTTEMQPELATFVQALKRHSTLHLRGISR